MLPVQKNQLYKSKLKGCGTIADMWLHSNYFCTENLMKILKQVQDERWGLEFSHTQAQCGDESCYKIVGRESLPCCAYMLCACCGPIFTTQNSLVPIWAVFGAKWHRSPSFRVVWPICKSTQPCVHGFLQHAGPHKISTPPQPLILLAFRFFCFRGPPFVLVP